MPCFGGDLLDNDDDKKVHVSHLYKSMENLKKQNDLITRLLCGLLKSYDENLLQQTLGEEGLEWWKQHQKLDETRKESIFR